MLRNCWIVEQYVCTYGSILRKRRLEFISVAPSWGRRNRTEAVMERVGWRNWHVILLMNLKGQENLWRTFNDLHYIQRTTEVKLRLLAPSRHSSMGVFVCSSYIRPVSTVTKHHTDTGIIPGTTVYVNSGAAPKLFMIQFAALCCWFL